MNIPLFPAKMAAGVLASFGVLALLLAAVGIYGVMSYVVAGRTREIGLRMALGAQTADVLRLILRQGMLLAMIGTIIGLVIGLGGTRLLKTLLYGVSAADPMTFTIGHPAPRIGHVPGLLAAGASRDACRPDDRAPNRIAALLKIRRSQTGVSPARCLTSLREYLAAANRIAPMEIAALRFAGAWQTKPANLLATEPQLAKSARVLFNSLTFVVFFAVVVSAYWMMRSWRGTQKPARGRELHFLRRVESAFRRAPLRHDRDGFLPRPDHGQTERSRRRARSGWSSASRST